MSSNPPMRIPAEFEEETLNPDGNPAVDALAQQAIAQANAAPTEEDREAPRPPTTNRNALHVKLPVGITNMLTGDEYREAEVRELNGSDEEYASRGKHFVDRKARLVERGVVSLGDEEAEKSVLMSMAVGDREAMLLAICRATYGDELSLDITCPSCKEEQEVTVDLATEIPIREYDSMQQEYTLKDGTSVTFHWATGNDEKAVWDFATKNPQATTSEMNTQMLAQVLDDVGGFEILTEDDARKLSMRHRSELMEFIGTNAPGPRYDELTATCASCEHEADLEVSFADMFR